MHESKHEIRLVDPSEWDAVVSAMPDRTVFHSLAWLRTLSQSHPVSMVLAKAERDGQCIGAWPYLELRKGPFRVIGSPLPGWSTAYLGPLFADQVAAPAEVVASFLRHRHFRRYVYFACKALNGRRGLDLTQFGFTKVAALDTYCIDLSLTREALWSNLKSECRTRIRKAQKLGIEVREEQDDSFLNEYWAMSVQTFQKSNMLPTHSRQFLWNLWSNLRPGGAVRAISAIKANRRMATLVLLRDDRAMYYWGGAAFSEFRELPLHNLLHWEAVCHAQDLGLSTYDFISTLGGPGRFKRTFGPELVAIGTHWERSPSWLLASIKTKYRNHLLRRRRVAVPVERTSSEQAAAT